MKGKEFIHNYLPFIGLVVVIVFFEIVTGGKLLSPRYISSLTNEVFTIMIGTCGLAFLLSAGMSGFFSDSRCGNDCSDCSPFRQELMNG